MVTASQIANVVGGGLVGLEPTAPVGPGVTASSREVNRGDIFVAVRGTAADGHRFVEDAFARGASVAVVEEPSALAGRPGIVTSNTRHALSRLSSFLHGDPSAQLKIVGITGTNGKTTTNWILYHLLNEIGGGALRIGTLGNECMGRDREEGTLTSPDPVSIQRLLRRAVDAGAKTCVMETSSHALDQARVEHVQFDVGVFMNLTRDHLDYHKTFEHYFEAKRHLFELLGTGPKSTKGAVINIDDPYGASLVGELESLGLKDCSFGRAAAAAVRIVEVQETPHDMRIALHLREEGVDVELRVPFIGPHNAENVTAAFASARALGLETSQVVRFLSQTPQVPGRLERIGERGPRVFVDYAHTPDALERVLDAVRVSTEGSLWCVFGCGGDRDKGKRPQMASIAGARADKVVVTSDNPRTEDPQSIIQDILSSAIQPTLVEVDRERAITQAIELASPNDTVVIAGKGHEDYQIIGTTKIHFSDQEVAARALSRRAAVSVTASDTVR
jgi:UDP-N-acetylmuramoyl-L-alanyl-D-glutamate--2,6-diaminopimelate ligase